jgi:hypothetical protein
MVIFGELFSRGYVNGIIEEAQRHGLKIIYSTVGRRDKDGTLRPLSQEELSNQPKPLVNVPLEAGFDMTPSKAGPSPVDQLAPLKMNDWETAKLNWGQIEQSQKQGREDFALRVAQYMKELAPQIESGKNVLFVHTMAGGVPRAKAVMPAMNRVFKVRGDKFTPSEIFWKTDIGRFCAQNFLEVTAETFRVLLRESSGIADTVKKSGGHVSYVAYGYHGTEVLIDGEYKWQTYSPYVQGWAKLELENIAKESFERGIAACVYNCPEILTNSSSIFQGLEVSLYPLLGALKKEGGKSKVATDLVKHCLAKMAEGTTVDKILKFTDSYMKNPHLLKHSVFEKWPQHNSREQMELMIQSSDELMSWHKDAKDSCNMVLSEEVFKATGVLMFHDSYAPKAPVRWLGHDVLAKVIAREA